MKPESSLPFWIVNAFVTADPFSGNPAAVCPLVEWLPEATLQAIAAQHNLSETAFMVPEGAGWRLRWFTPACEVDLCGHATLATAAVLFETGGATKRCQFATRRGELVVERGDHGWLWMDFPAQVAKPAPAPATLGEVFGPVVAVARNELDYLLVEVESAEGVRTFVPEWGPLAQIGAFGVMLTAPGGARNVDFVSRFFAPRAGILEDPVTGSAHCTLFPWWAEKAGRTSLRARQWSPRGGHVEGEWRRDGRVRLGGRAQIFAAGQLWLTAPA